MIMMKMGEGIMTNDELSDLIQRDESDWLEFKQVWHKNKAELLHDILCLVNSYAPGKGRYIVFGVSDAKVVVGLESTGNRMLDHNFQDWLSKLPLNRKSIRARVLKRTLSEKEIDVLEIDNIPLKPFYLKEDYKEECITVKDSYIYTRTNSRNTSKFTQADDYSIELMWKERFGVDLAPLGRLNLLLDDSTKWQSGRSIGDFYHLDSPEFTVHAGNTREEFSEAWSDRAKFCDTKHNSMTTYELRYFNTVLAEVMIVDLDGHRCHLPLPERDGQRFFISRNSFKYKIAKFLPQYDELDTTLENRCGVEIID